MCLCTMGMDLISEVRRARTDARHRVAIAVLIIGRHLLQQVFFCLISNYPGYMGEATSARYVPFRSVTVRADQHFDDTRRQQISRTHAQRNRVGPVQPSSPPRRRPATTRRRVAGRAARRALWNTRDGSRRKRNPNGLQVWTSGPGHLNLRALRGTVTRPLTAVD